MKKLVSVIDIGSTAIRLVILELDENGGYQRVDRASRPISLGRDVFITKTIKPENMMTAVQILTGFFELLKSWGLEPNDTYVLATSAVREARNKDIFVDRVRTKTGFNVQIIDGVEENHLTYIAVQHAVENLRGSFSRANSIIIEVGGGSTEIMVLYRGKMQAAQSLKVGTVRMEQQIQSSQTPNLYTEDILKDQFRLHISALHANTDMKRIKYFIMVGGDARIAAYQVGKTEGEHYSIISRQDFMDFVTSVLQKSAEELVGDLSITYNEAEGLVSALLIYRIFLEETNAQEILVPDVSIREGILLRNVLGQRSGLDADFSKQVMASATNLARRYNIEEDHAQKVRALSLSLYDQLSSEHGLGNRERLYLEVAALLHDIGYYINQSGHHKHGQYIVANSEVFGLSKGEMDIISNVVRYHRGAKPVNSHLNFGSLSREQRLVILKLSAILRVANALDRSQIQSSGSVTMEFEGSTIFLSCSSRANTYVERYGLGVRAGLFEDVFGYKLIVR